MLQKKILVPLGASEKSLKSVHHALALAKRLGAQVYILQQAASTDSTDPLAVYLEEALLDLINSARQAGLTLSHYIANRDLKEEIVGMARDEGIDLLVFEADDEIGRRLLLQVKPRVTGQIIQVREKNDGDSPSGDGPEEVDGIEIEHVSGRPGRGTDPERRAGPIQKAQRDEARETGVRAFSKQDRGATRPPSGQGGNHEQSLQDTRYR
jgi:nucleotide-binding universal stress UspA family protein